MDHKAQKNLRKALYNNFMDAISWYELKFDAAPPEVYAAAAENAPNILQRIKLNYKARKAK